MNTGTFLEKTKLLWPLLAVHFLVRLLVATVADLGNDEVYYTLYAKDLDFSYFDHPPLVGYLIYVTTFFGSLVTELSVRFGALLIGTFNVFLLYQISKELSGLKAGNIALILGISSLYVSIISGTFIMPDTPQSLFWMLALWSFIRFTRSEINFYLLAFGLFTGLALLSKYHAVYLLLGAGLYALVVDSKLFKNPSFYLAFLIAILCTLPVILWNMESPYSGLSYHESRVGSGSILPNFKFFFQEIFGQIFYNNPFVVFLSFTALSFLFKERRFRRRPEVHVLLYFSLPLILTTIILSMYSRTLPHWSGPGYFGLIILSSLVFSRSKFLFSKKLSLALKGALVLFGLVITLGLVQITTGVILGESKKEGTSLGKNDFTVDLSAWDALGKALDSKIPAKIKIVTHNWFPAAHLDFYHARKKDSKVYVLGPREKKHQFLKINEKNGVISPKDSVYYITTSHYYQAPDSKVDSLFNRDEQPKEILIRQNGKKKVNLYLWKLSPKKEVNPSSL